VVSRLTEGVEDYSEELERQVRQLIGMFLLVEVSSIVLYVRLMGIRLY